MGDDGGGHCLVRMEWRQAGWSMCLPLLIFPCTIKSRSFLLTLAHLGGPGKRAVKRLLCGGGAHHYLLSNFRKMHGDFLHHNISRKTVGKKSMKRTSC